MIEPPDAKPEYDYWHWYYIRIGLLERDKCCRYCRKPLDKYTVTIDHFVPKSRGGTDDFHENLVASCKECNQDKGDMPPELFLEIIKRRP